MASVQLMPELLAVMRCAPEIKNHSEELRTKAFYWNIFMRV